jgi:hypothetical protein
MKTSYRATGPHTYEVSATWTTPGARPSAPLISNWQLLGTVKRFGSLPSMRHWRAQPLKGEWGPPRRTRKLACADLLPVSH